MLKTIKPIVSLDIESAGPEGPSPALDRIIDLAMVKRSGSDVESIVIRVNPEIPISEARVKCHGITDAMVSECPPFRARAQGVLDFLSGCVLVGYNAKRYDIPLLHEEFHRCGIVWDLSEVTIIDPSVIFQKKEPRDLSAAVKKYCLREHVGAHGAQADAVAALDVLCGQMLYYDDIDDMTMEELAKLSTHDAEYPPIDFAGKFILKDGKACYGFKKYGTPVEDDPGLAEWMTRQNFFTADTIAHCDRILQSIYDAMNPPLNER